MDKRSGEFELNERAILFSKYLLTLYLNFTKVLRDVHEQTTYLVEWKHILMDNEIEFYKNWRQ